jgi:lysophospholipase L1-like esterase
MVHIKRRGLLMAGGLSLGFGLGLPFARAGLDISLSNRGIDETAAPGTTVGALSMRSAGGSWTYSLLDNAGGRFALSGANVVVGATALDHAAVPSPTIKIEATDGRQAVTRTFALNVRKPLPSLPLPAGARLNIVGHSQLAYTHYSGTAVSSANAAVGTDAKGVLAAYHTLDPRFDMDSWYDTSDPLGRNIVGADYAVFGAHLDAIDAQLTMALQHKPEAIVMMGGSNTIATGDDGVAAPANVHYSISKVEAQLQRCRNAGVPVILMTDYPRGAWIGTSPSDAEKSSAVVDYNTWVRAQSGRDGVRVVDCWDLLAPGGIQDVTLFEPDLTHLNPRGAAKMAAHPAMAAAFQAVFSAGEHFSTDPTTSDQLLSVANYGWAASGSAASGTVTGTKASALSFVTTPSAGSSVVCSMEQIGSTGRYKQVCAITPGDNGSGNLYHGLTFQTPNSAVTGLAAGDWVRHSVIVEIGGASENLGELRVRPQVCQGSTVRAQASLLNTASPDFSLIPGLPASIRKVISPPMQIPADVSFDRCRSFVEFYWPRAAVGAFQVKFHSPKWARIADPRIARGY